MDKQTVLEINEKLLDALCADFEHGVKSLNENAFSKFKKHYPELNNFIGWLNELEDELTKDDE